jgi:hypothetical protein
MPLIADCADALFSNGPHAIEAILTVMPFHEGLMQLDLIFTDLIRHDIFFI